MEIVVLIKQVPETGNVKMDEKSGTMVREGVESIVNPLDLYALEAALELKEQFGGRVTAVTMGPPSAHRSLREAVAMGCDRAVLLSDRSLAGSDTWATAYILGKALQKLQPFDLVICGERATDGDTGQVGPGVASFLDLPLATYVAAIEVSGGVQLTVRRAVEGGYQLRLPLPALLTVVKEVAYPRLPTLRGKQRARSLEIPCWAPADIGADSARVGLKGSPTRVVKIFRPRLARKGKMIAVREGEEERAVEEIVTFLLERNLL